MDVFLAAAGTLIGIVVGLLGILIALRPPSRPRTQKIVGFSVAALSLVAVITEVHIKRVESDRQKKADGQMSTLQGSVEEARNNEAKLLQSNQQLQASNAHLEVQLEELKQKPGAYEAAQAGTLREDISKQLDAVKKYLVDRNRKSPAWAERPGQPGYSVRETDYQVETHVLYAQQLCPETARLLKRAFEMRLTTTAPHVTCSTMLASGGVLEGIVELNQLFERLPGK